MQIPKQATLLRIFVGEDDRHGHQPLYQAIVLKARETAPGRRHRAARADGLRPFEPAAYGENPASFGGSAGRRRNRRQRRADQWLSAGARRDDDQRADNAGARRGAAIRHRARPAPAEEGNAVQGAGRRCASNLVALAKFGVTHGRSIGQRRCPGARCRRLAISRSLPPVRT